MLCAILLCTQSGVLFAQEEALPPDEPLPESAIPLTTPPAPPPLAAEPEKQKPFGLPKGHGAAWLAAGGAAAALTLGGVFLLNEKARDRDVDRLADAGLGDGSQARDIRRSRERFHWLSLAGFIGAGALAATSVTLFAVSPDGFQLTTEVSF